MRLKKIITHAGTFHADEVSACALIKTLHKLMFGEDIPVVRTYSPSQQDMDDPDVIVLDIGRVFDPKVNLYDHHQNAELPASNILVLDHVAPAYGGISIEEIAFLKSCIFTYISDVDTGKVVENKNSPPTINSIIRMCNNMPEIGFDVALTVAGVAISVAIETARRRLATRDAWNRFPRVCDVRINDTKVYPVGWQELAEEEGVRFLVSPNPRVEGQYQVTSRDAEIWPIPPHPDQVFLHNSGFIAAYVSRQAAINHAVTL